MATEIKTIPSSSEPLVPRVAIFALVICTIGYAMLLPSPYNPQYWVKRALFTPTAECRDGIYSFSRTRSGTCSGHGGVKKWVATRRAG